MTTNHMSGIVQDTVDQVKAAGTKIYDNTVDKAANAAKGVLTPGSSANTGINGGANLPVTTPTDTSAGPSSTTKTAVVAVGAALVIWGVYHYMHNR